MYEYTAQLIRVVDGDTAHFDVDLGFDVKRKDSFRFYGINAPERGTPEGTEATQWLTERLKHGSITLKTVKDKREKFGRYLAVVYVDGVNINEELVAQGLAREYMV